MTIAHFSRNDWSRAVAQAVGDRLPGRPVQDIHTQSTTQNYTLGSKLILPAPDNREYRYFYAQEALVRYLGGYQHNQWPIDGNLLTAAVAGAKTLKVPDAAGAAHAYKGGYIVIFSSPLQAYLIVDNAASDGTEVELTLERAIQTGAAIGIHVTGYPTMYGNVQAPPAPDPDYISFVCVPNIDVTINNYFWGQVKGWCYGVASSSVPGAAANDRDVFFSTAGNVLAATDAGANQGLQYAGYLLPRTQNGAGDQLYFLKLE